MNRLLALGLLLLLVAPGRADPPAYRLRDQQMQYYGPRHERQAEPETETINIAWFGPDDPQHPQGGDLWSAASMAVEEANASDGYRGRKFQLRPVWSDSPWGEGARRLAERVYRDGVVAVVGGINGASTHVAEQIAAKARLPVISPVATDKSINLAGVPWIFSCLPGDHLIAPVLADSLANQKEPRRIVLLSSTEHDAHLFSVEVQAALRDRKIGLAQHYEFDPRNPDASRLCRQTIDAGATAVIVSADARTSAEIVLAFCQMEFRGAIYLGPEGARRRFVELAGPAAEGVLVPMPSASCSERCAEFTARFQARCGHRPDYAAAQTYDALAMLVAAIRGAGPNRALIADSLRDLSPYDGVAGPIRWDPVGANTRNVTLGMYRKGEIVKMR